MRIRRYWERTMLRSWFFQSATGSSFGVVVQPISSFCPSGPVNRSPAGPDDRYFHPLGSPIEYPWLPRYVCSADVPPPLPADFPFHGPPPAPAVFSLAPGAVSLSAGPVASPSVRVPSFSSDLVSALGASPAAVRSPPALAPVPPSSSPPLSATARTMPSRARATTTAMRTSVRRGTTSVSDARGTGLGGRSGGVITGHPELRPPDGGCCRAVPGAAAPGAAAGFVTGAEA